MSASIPPGASSQAEANQDTRHGYAPVNGLNKYYEIHGTVSQSQLAILPGADHVTLMDRAELLVPIVEAFLDAPIPGRM